MVLLFFLNKKLFESKNEFWDLNEIKINFVLSSDGFLSKLS